MDKTILISSCLIIGFILGIFTISYYSDMDRTYVAICNHENKTHVVEEQIYIGNGAYMDKLFNNLRSNCDNLSIKHNWKITWGFSFN